MGNCLVTKLKANVDNPNLKEFGAIRIYLRALDNYGLTRPKHKTGTSPCVCTYVNSEGEIIKTVTTNVETSSNVKDYITTGDGGYVEITNKYNLATLGAIPAYSLLQSNLNPKAIEYEYVIPDMVCGYDTMANWGKYTNIFVHSNNYQIGDYLDYVRERIQKDGVGNGYVHFGFNHISNTLESTTFNGVVCSNYKNDYGFEGWNTGLHWKDNGTKVWIQWYYDNTRTQVWSYGFTDEEITELTGEGGDWENAYVIKVD